VIWDLENSARPPPLTAGGAHRTDRSAPVGGMSAPTDTPTTTTVATTPGQDQWAEAGDRPLTIRRQPPWSAIGAGFTPSGPPGGERPGRAPSRTARAPASPRAPTATPPM